MKYLTQTLAITGLLGAFALPAFAQDAEMDPATMTCADLMAMDEAGQMEAMTAMEMAMAETEGTEMTEEEAMAAGEEMMPGTMTACEGNDDMMAMEAMQAGMNQ